MAGACGHFASLCPVEGDCPRVPHGLRAWRRTEGLLLFPVKRRTQSTSCIDPHALDHVTEIVVGDSGRLARGAQQEPRRVAGPASMALTSFRSKSSASSA